MDGSFFYITFGIKGLGDNLVQIESLRDIVEIAAEGHSDQKLTNEPTESQLNINVPVEILRSLRPSHKPEHLDEVKPIPRAFTNEVCTPILSHEFANQIYCIVSRV